MKSMNGLGGFMKKKLAIITLYDNVNFGNRLQNYAVQTYFDAMGYEVVTLPYWEQLHPVHSIRNDTHKLAHIILQSFGFEKERIKSDRLKQERRDYITGFSDQYIKVGPVLEYTKINTSLKEKYDYFVTGSDQVWHSWTDDKRELEFFFLQFANPKQRITMAPSFGFDEFPKKYLKIYKKGLDGFKYISCREEKGKELIESLTGKSVTVLLDPTMLIELNNWLKILRKPRQFVSSNYIFVYALGGLDENVKNSVNQLAKEKQYSVIDINDVNSQYYTATRPDEFLYWIKESKLVVTDSFHATVFSILFNRPFVVISRKDELGMENRLDTLLRKFSFTGRKYKELKDVFDKIDDPIQEEKLFSVDFKGVGEVIDREKKKAADFFENCFSSIS